MWGDHDDTSWQVPLHVGGVMDTRARPLLSFLSSLLIVGCYSHTVLAPSDIPTLTGARPGDKVSLSHDSVRIRRGTKVIVGVEAGRTLVFDDGDAPERVPAIAKASSSTAYALGGLRHNADDDTLEFAADGSRYYLPYSASPTRVAVSLPAGTSEARYAHLLLESSYTPSAMIASGFTASGLGTLAALLAAGHWGLTCVFGCTRDFAPYRAVIVTSAATAFLGLGVGIVGLVLKRRSEREPRVAAAPFGSAHAFGMLGEMSW